MTGKKNKLTVSLTALFFICVLFFKPTVVFAEDENVILQMRKLDLKTGEKIFLHLKIIYEKDLGNVEISELDNFEVLSIGRATIIPRTINGKSMFEQSFVYTVIPKKAGEFKLKGIVMCDGVTYESNELTVKVQDKDADEEERINDTFIETNISHDEIYFGEKVVVGYELYSRSNIENYRFLTEVKIDEVITNHIPEDKLSKDFINVNGNDYTKYEVKKMFIFPVKVGTITIPNYEFKANVSTKDFFKSGKPVYLQTQGKEIKVKPLPLENKPDDFSGIVGNLNIKSEYSQKEINYGDSVTLKVTAQGNCNLDNFKRIINGKLEGFSVYETEKNFHENIVDYKYTAKKEFEVILVPEKTGKLSIEPIEIFYFDTESKTYKKAEIKGTTIEVKGKMTEVQTSSQSNSEAVEKIVINQVSYDTSNEEYFTISIKMKHLWVVIVAVIMLIAAVVIGVIHFRRQMKKDRRLEAIYRRLKKAGDEKEIYNVFNEMIKYKFRVSLKANSKDVVIQSIEDDELAGLVIEVIEYMESREEEINLNTLKDKIKKIYIIFAGM
ncbi:BatD family protein [Oceanirhabdus sp. W0125-5]|uniref:BatD family protein n=1 Tax=Oceanirhabdus sp. W0125-5 TaxID=2999116 RepID=UPI0022F2DA77|nr:BatD family protein [Oceanirhabdus sp. W0125-5]WBW98256.1 BatD family protein [Oceanirhabdus sp. W0125-5]